MDSEGPPATCSALRSLNSGVILGKAGVFLEGPLASAARAACPPGSCTGWMSAASEQGAGCIPGRILKGGERVFDRVVGAGCKVGLPFGFTRRVGSSAGRSMVSAGVEA